MLEKLHNVAYVSQDFGRHDPRRGFLVPLVAQEEMFGIFYAFKACFSDEYNRVSERVALSPDQEVEPSLGHSLLPGSGRGVRSDVRANVWPSLETV